MSARLWRNAAACMALAGVLQGAGQPVAAQTAQNQVLQIELRLLELGYLLNGADGVATQESVDAVIAFQRNHGLSPDGKLGQTERMLLFSSAARKVDGTSVSPSPPKAVTSAPVPIAPAVPAQQTSAPVQQVANTSPLGAWYGEMTCEIRSRKTYAETEFTIKNRKDGVLGMTMIVGTGASMGSGTSQIRYVGEPTSGGYRFVIEKVVRSPIFGNNRNSNQEIRFDPATGRMEPTAGCKPFVARRQQQPDPRLIATVPSPANGGSYFAATPGRNRCEVLINWADKANQEFPGRNFYRQNKAGDDWILIKLFADDDFVPVFGQPYDGMTYEARRTIAQDARKCRQDPFTRNRLETYLAAADRVMAGNPDQQLTSNGYSSTIFAIRQIRAIRNELRALASGTAQARAGESFAQTVSRLDGVKSRADKKSGRLWPSETGAIGAEIDRFLSQLAVREATGLLSALSTTTDADKGLKSIATHNKKVSSEAYFARYLSPSDRKSLKTQIAGLQQKFADDKAAPILARAAKVETGIAGAIELNTLISQLQKINALSASQKKRMTDQLTQARDVRIETHVDASLSKVANLPATLVGLTAEQKWLDQFDQASRGLRSNPKIKAARQKVLAARETRLEAALPKFEATLGTLSSADEADALLAQYLSVKGDHGLPIALEYQLLVELAK